MQSSTKYEVASVFNNLVIVFDSTSAIRGGILVAKHAESVTEVRQWISANTVWKQPQVDWTEAAAVVGL